MAAEGGWVVKAMYASLAVALFGGALTLKDSISGTDTGNTTRCFLDPKTGDVVEYTLEEWQAKVDELNREYVDTVVAPKNAQIAQKMRDSLEGKPDAMMEMLPPFPSWGTPQWPVENPNTGQKTMIQAKKCPKCGEVFPLFDEKGKWSDKCPKCGYSELEAKKKALKKKR